MFKASQYTDEEAEQLVLLLDAVNSDTCEVCLNRDCAGAGQCNTDDIYPDLMRTYQRFISDGLRDLAIEYKATASSGIQREYPPLTYADIMLSEEYDAYDNSYVGSQ